MPAIKRSQSAASFPADTSGNHGDNVPAIKWVAFCLLMLCGLIACAPQGESWARIQQEGVLQVGLDPTYPPFEEAINEDLWGIDVDLARAIGEDLGLEVIFFHFGYDGLYDALETKQVDLLISALTIQPAKTQDFAYSRPYFNAGQLLVVPKSVTHLQSLEELTTERVAVEIGSQGHLLATSWSRRLPDITVIPLNSGDEALAAVRDGAAEVTIIDSVSGRLFVKEEATTKWLPAFAHDEPYALVVRKEDEILLTQINEALIRLEDAGILEQIISSWLGD